MTEDARQLSYLQQDVHHAHVAISDSQTDIDRLRVMGQSLQAKIHDYADAKSRALRSGAPYGSGASVGGDHSGAHCQFGMPATLSQNRKQRIRGFEDDASQSNADVAVAKEKRTKHLTTLKAKIDDLVKRTLAAERVENNVETTAAGKEIRIPKTSSSKNLADRMDTLKGAQRLDKMIKLVQDRGVDMEERVADHQERSDKHEQVIRDLTCRMHTTAENQTKHDALTQQQQEEALAQMPGIMDVIGELRDHQSTCAESLGVISLQFASLQNSRQTRIENTFVYDLHVLPVQGRASMA